MVSKPRDGASELRATARQVRHPNYAISSACELLGVLDAWMWRCEAKNIEDG